MSATDGQRLIHKNHSYATWAEASKTTKYTSVSTTTVWCVNQFTNFHRIKKKLIPVFLVAKFARGTGRRDAVIFTVHRYQKFIQGKTPHPQQLPQPTTNCNMLALQLSVWKKIWKKTLLANPATFSLSNHGWLLRVQVLWLQQWNRNEHVIESENRW